MKLQGLSLDSPTSRPIELSEYCTETEAMLAVIDPERYASSLIELGVFTCEHVNVEESRKNRLKWATLSGVTENKNGVYKTGVLIQFPGIFARGLWHEYVARSLTL
ncbi:hypothetical protein COU91_02025 [Candidatus Saccharibacteria bacterium CG10_big_fil_rev_8_21_14_0_10_47_8]|nr:MAG: hypothetical protein COU91_02025 [Candidatus Saccharibacteria bacterium CG10_big_fil_rev_8_21_14_0_10_47_8]